MRLKEGARFADRFTVEKHLSDGGFGAVYQCLDEVSKKRVALKILHPNLWSEPKVVVRFEREATLLKTLDHVNVVQLVDWGIDEGTKAPWMALEFLFGAELWTHVKGGVAMPPSMAAHVFAQLGEAMRAVQGLGVIHADLKPENIMLIGDGPMPLVKVIDFGIAHWIRDGKTHTQVTTTIFSPLWAAPEQFAQGALVRASTDVWSLGLIAFRLFSGKAYWLNAQEGHERVIPTVREALMDPLVPASERAKALGVEDKLPAGFDAWFRHCVVRNPEERFQRADAAVRALLTLLTPKGLTTMIGAPLNASTSATWISRAGARGTVALPKSALPVVVAMMEAGDWSAVREALDDAKAKGDDHAELWAMRGSCNLQLGRFDEALADHHEAITRAPGVAAYLLGRAEVFDAMGDERAARADRALASVSRAA